MPGVLQGDLEWEKPPMAEPRIKHAAGKNGPLILLLRQRSAGQEVAGAD